MILKPSDLATSLQQIASKVADHCEHGEQSKNLQNMLACGQFYGNDVRPRRQKGLHGSAAAAGLLLASQTKHNIEIAKKLLKYTENHSNTPENDLDNLNTIKQAEILAAIDGRINLAEASDYCQKLINNLITYRDSSTGSWGYFLDNKDKVDSKVATSHALLALHQHVPPDDLLKTKEYLWKKQESLIASSNASDIYAIAIRSLILFSLAKCKNNNNTTEPFNEKELRMQTSNLWKKCRSFYESSFEVTVEYHWDDKNQYLRLPWQIYLAHAVLLVDNSIFYTARFQKYLESISRQVAEQGGYKYDHAGRFLSTRTNGILYNFIDFARNLNPPKNYISIAKEKSLEIWRSKIVRIPIIFGLGVGTLYFAEINKALLESHSSLLNDLINGATTAFLAWLYGTGKE